MFEITVDCRIDWKNFKKWDIVSEKDTWWYFTSCMKPINAEQPQANPEPANEVEETPVENTDEEATENADEEKADEVVEKADEVEEKPTKSAKKRK